MMRMLLLSLVVIGVTADSSMLTMDQLDQAIQDLQTNPNYIPNYIAEPLLQATDQEKQEYIDFLNKINRGEINVQNKDQLRQAMQEVAPNASARLESIFEALFQKYENLSQEAKDFVDKWLNQLIALLNNNNNNKSLIIQKMKEFSNEVQNLPPETLQSFQQQFPELASALQNWISQQDVQNFLNNLPDDGSEQDPNDVNEYINKMNQVWPVGVLVPQMLNR